MKHMSTWDLLDLAEDLINLRDMSATHARKNATMIKLASIDTELLSRIPEFSYVTVLNDSGNPVGFEPYIGEDNEYLAFERQAYEQARLDDDLDYGYYLDKMG